MDIQWPAAAGVTFGCIPPVNDRFCPTTRRNTGPDGSVPPRALGALPTSIPPIEGGSREVRI